MGRGREECTGLHAWGEETGTLHLSTLLGDHPAAPLLTVDSVCLDEKGDDERT